MARTKDALELMEDVLFLRRNPIFADVGSMELKAIAAIANDRTFMAGEYVVREGEPGDALFLVKSGKVDITKNTGQGVACLASLGPAGCFGEMVIFEDAPRSADCQSTEESLLMVIRREELLEVVQQHPKIAIELFRVIGSRLRAANEKVKELSTTIAQLKK